MTKKEAVLEVLGLEISDEAREVFEKMVEQLDRPRSMGPAEKAKREAAIKFRQDIVEYVAEHPKMAAKDIAAHFEVNTSKIVGQLTILTKDGTLVKEAGARSKDPKVYSVA